MTLNNVKSGIGVVIEQLKIDALSKSRLLALGIDLGKSITVLKNLCVGVLIEINGKQVAICKNLARNILVYEK